MNILKLLPGIRKNISLKNYTTFRIGGSAKYFFEAKTENDIIEAITVAKQLKLPFIVLGAGSNILVSDKGYKGFIIRIDNQELKINNKKFIVGAGTMLGKLVTTATKNNLSGMEWAVGIPGTVGGAVWGNAGAFKKSMAGVTKTVTVLEIRNKLKNLNYQIKIYNNKDCKFGYRDSVFKKKSNSVILSTEINLKKSNKKEINKKVKEYSIYRVANQPLNYPSAGSIFRNPAPERGKSYKFSAGELIEKCGLKGTRIGDAKISEKHANFIVNLGNASAKDVKRLINLVKTRVKNKFGVILREEIKFI